MIEALRDGTWCTPLRLHRYAMIVLVACVAGLVLLLATSDGKMDSMRRPLGTDFSQVWSAGVEVVEGHSDAPFDPATHAAKQRALFGADTPFYGWHYPPYFLAVAAALAMLPYLAALAAWQGTTLAFYLASMLGILARRSRRPGALKRPVADVLVAAGAFPAVFVNLTHGHNGFLTAALLAFGLMSFRTRPLLAGVFLGLLAYKPQFALVIPVAFAAQGSWRTVFSGIATVAATTLITVAVFGTKTWMAFAGSLAFTRTVVLEQGDTGWSKIQSTFAAARMLGAGIEQAYVWQAVVTTLVILTVALAWRGNADDRIKAALLLVGSLLTTPYCLDYDMMILGPALAFAISYGLEHGFGPWEKSIYAATWAVPAFARIVAASTGIPIGLLVMVGFFAVLTSRALSPTWAKLRPKFLWSTAEP